MNFSESQGAIQPGTHHLKLDKAHLRCAQCKGYVLARAGEEILNRFLGEVCHHGPLAAELWQGHPSHQMERNGNTVERQRCHGRAKFQGSKLLLTTKLRNLCSKPVSRDIRSMLAWAQRAPVQTAEKSRTKHVNVYIHTYIHAYIHVFDAKLKYTEEAPAILQAR